MSKTRRKKGERKQLEAVKAVVPKEDKQRQKVPKRKEERRKMTTIGRMMMILSQRNLE